jgi:AAA15 family ATPase/GTPase
MSYKDEVSLSMVASTTVKECEGDQGGYTNVSTLSDGKRLLRTAAIYGANGSGKSTLIAAMDIFKKMILRSFVNENLTKSLSQLYYRFDVESRNEPISMQMIFVCNGERYRYGFEVRQNEVLTEWLFVVLQGSSKESYCFKREGQSIKVNSKIFKGARGIDTKTRNNALFISTAAQFNVEIAMRLKEWFLSRFNVLSGLDDTIAFTAKAFMQDNLIREQIMHMISIVDGCIKQVSVQEKVKEVEGQDAPMEVLSRLGVNIPKELNEKIGKMERHELEIQAAHDVFDHGHVVGNDSLNFRMESLGTTKLFALLGPFFDTIQHGGVLIIDEFGASLHTQLSVELLKLFYSPLNGSNAQLVVTTHDTNLLRKDLLRRDQIWFAEKSPEGVSDLYSLVEYKINQANSVRNDASFSKDYLLGRYGAIPYFGNIEKFILEYGGKKESE